MDQYADLRNLPLLAVLQALGVNYDWKERKGGTEHAGRCPFHEPKKNQSSFSFSDSGVFHCFSCQVKGKGAIDLVKEYRKCSFQEATEWLKGLSIKPSPPKQEPVPQVQANQPFQATYEKYFVDSQWLKDRGLNPETLQAFTVGEYNNPARKSIYSGSVMLKIRRYSDGESVGYLSRNIGEITPEKPKYSFPKGFHKSLEVYGAWQIKERQPVPIRTCFLVESPFTVLAFHQKGFTAVSPFGWSISPEQARILRDVARGFILLPDKDKRAEAIPQIASILSPLCWIKAPEYPAEDPEQLTFEQIKNLT